MALFVRVFFPTCYAITFSVILCKTPLPGLAMPPIGYPGNSISKEARAKDGGGFESAIEVIQGGTAPSVSGTIADGQQITVSALSGESFGVSGPNLIHYHDGRNGTENTSLGISDSPIGTWDVANSNTLYKSGGKIRPLATQLTSPTSLDGKNRITFPDATEIFVSYWMRFDTDPTTFAASFKVLWLLDGPDGSQPDYYDCVLMSKVNTTTRWVISGNTQPGIDETPNGFLSANEWTRCAFWLKDNGASEMGYNAQLLNATNGQNLQLAPDDPETVMLNNAPLSTAVNRINMFGDLNNNNNGHAVTFLMDGFYVSTGANSRARVEITDTENYSDATMKEAYFCTPESWSDSQITATVRAPDGLSGKYLHVHDANGNHTNNNVGRLIS